MNFSFKNSPYLASVRKMDTKISTDMQRKIADTVRIALRDYYVHLPLKMSRYSINPVEELENLMDDMEVEVAQFSYFNRLVTIVNKLRDRHTTITLPAPLSTLAAFLPFMTERYFDNGDVRVIVSKIFGGYANPDLELGSSITHWNGIPIQSFLEIVGANSQGSNYAARVKWAESTLTIRSLGNSLPPFEDWATLSLITPRNEQKTVTIPWKVYQSNPQQTSFTGSSGSAIGLTGLDEHYYRLQGFRKDLFVGAANNAPVTDFKVEGVLKYGNITADGREVGYLRIYSFEVGDAVKFINSLANKILPGLNQDRLIIDIRSNPGGYIPAGEHLLQLISPHPVVLSPVSFRSTEATQSLVTLDELSSWRTSIDLRKQTGEIFSQGIPLSTLDNLPTYRYPGTVGLITDSLSYSTSDFFAAGFQDNNLGVVVGTDDRTGAGGANVWPYPTLVQFANKAAGKVVLEQLPLGMGLNISMRRSLRTGTAAGLPVEDLGTQSDFVYQLTADDLLRDNVDLLDFTASKLR